ncbi:T9SS type A sorting domain-containing protein [Winogradskyella pulchriflava]|uniref:T9SS type A sorting domain-containing protein n=1 Tax=Winogradskyella pulchriflava TaxID=1110688 RepID=A0ABV6Q6C8_9FLAO
MKIHYIKVLLAVSLFSFLTSYGYSNKAATEINTSNELLIFSYPTSLSNFEYEVNLGPSTNQTFSINDGLLLTRPYTITAPAGFEVSTSSSSGFSNSIVIPGAVIDLGSVTVYVRLASGLAIGTYSGDLTITAPDAWVLTILYPEVDETISLSGEVKRRETTWDGSTWNNGTPDIEAITTIDSNYSTTTNGSISSWSLTVTSGAQLTVNNDTYVEIENDVVVDGNITLESSGALVQNEDTATFTVNSGGTSIVKKSTSALKNWYDYTYWSSPVNGATASTAFSDSNPNYRFWFNAQNFLDVLEEVDNTNTYVSGHDDIDDNGDDWTLLGNSDVLAPGVGYATTHTPVGFTSGNSYEYEFSGPFNTGTITTPIYYNGDNGDNDWNFIGNPYPSAISADDFFTENASVVGDAIYLWSHATLPSSSAGGNEVLNYSSDDYAIINSGSGEIAGGSTVIPNRYIPSGQGFFVQGAANGNATFNNAMRMTDNTSNSQFFRPNTPMQNKLWVNLTSDNGVFNQILVAYVDGATDNNDGSAYDSPRFLSSGTAAVIYTSIENDTDTKYAIQGKATTSLNTQETIGIGFFTAITEATVYTFSIPKKQGDFMNTNPIFIKDNLLNVTHNLLESDYSFTSSTGEFNDRFEIVFTSETLSVKDEVLQNSVVISELNKNSIKLSANGTKQIETVELYNIEGKRVCNKEINNFDGVINVSNLNVGTYIAQVKFDNGAMVKQKLIKRR